MAKRRPVETQPFGDLSAPPKVAPTAQGFYVRAVRPGINPTTQSLVGKDAIFYLADPKKFSDAHKEFVREVTDKDGKRTGKFKHMGVTGWMERVDTTAPASEPEEPVTDATPDVI